MPRRCIKIHDFSRRSRQKVSIYLYNISVTTTHTPSSRASPTRGPRINRRPAPVPCSCSITLRQSTIYAEYVCSLLLTSPIVGRLRRWYWGRN